MTVIPIGDVDPEDAFDTFDPFDDRLDILRRTVASVEVAFDEDRARFRITAALAELARMLAEQPSRLDDLLPLILRLAMLP